MRSSRRSGTTGRCCFCGPIVVRRTARIIAIDLRSPIPPRGRRSCPRASSAIENVALLGGRIVVEYLEDVKSRLAMFDLDGTRQGDVALPGPGSLSGFIGRQDSPLMFYAFTSPLYPTTVFAYDLTIGKSTPFEAGQRTDRRRPLRDRAAVRARRRTARACRSS